jgi:hypothetical protein
MIHRSNNYFLRFTLENAKEGHEGKGVYLSEQDNFKSYGAYKYIVKSNCIKTYMFTSIKSITKIIKDFLKQYDTKKLVLKEFNNEYIKQYIEGIRDGDYSVRDAIRNIWDCVECQIYNRNYKFDLLEYNAELLKRWEWYLSEGIIVYFDKQFNQNIIFVTNPKNLIIAEMIDDNNVNSYKN